MTTTTPPTPPSWNADRTPDGMGWRVGVSIVTLFGLVSFLLLYFAFWAGAFVWYQNFAIVVVALLVFVAANGAAWAGWGMRHAGRAPG